MSNSNDKKSEGSIGWMARNSIAANLLMIVLLGGGLFFAVNMQKEVFPEYTLDAVSVSVGYPGAAPTEVEQGILLPIEEAIQGVDGIKRMRSWSREGRAWVNIEMVAGANRMKVFQDIDQAINRIRTFPEDIDQPDVELRSSQRQVLRLSLYGDVEYWTLRQLGERLRDQLRANEDISQVQLNRVLGYETQVEIPRDTLREYDLTLNEVARIIRASSEDVAAGSVETASGEIALRMKERKQFSDEFGEIEIVTGESGEAVTLAEIAQITDGFEDGGFVSQFNGKPSVQIGVYRIGDQSPLDIARAVEKEMAGFEMGLPPGVEWRISSNDAEEFRQRVSLVVENGLLAIVIVMVILSLFLELRLAFWVMMGMVISFFGGILFLPILDVSINMITLFGFLIVLGIVVDDAIVVGENVYEHRQQGKGAMESAVKGTRQVAGPVIFSILSNIVAFIPLMMIPGEMGKFWGPLPIVVIIVLAVSLFEALYILPAHLGHQKRLGDTRTGISKFCHDRQRIFANAFDRFVDTKYRAVLKKALKYRYITFASALALLVVSLTYSQSAHMGMINMPEVAAHEIEAGIRLPVGVTPDKAAEIAQIVTDATIRMVDEHDLHTTVAGVSTNVRRGSFVDCEIVMLPPDEAELNANQIIEIWRDEIGDLPGISQIKFEAEAGPSGGRDGIRVDLSHNDIDVLEKVTKSLVATAESFSNTRDVNDNFNRGQTQFDFTLRPEGAAMGFTPEYIGRELRSSFFGALALRMMRGTNEVEVRVKLPAEERKEIYHLENMIIRSPSGIEVPLMEVVDLKQAEAFATINRVDGLRRISVSMDAEPKRTASQIIKELDEVVLPDLRAAYPGLTWSFEGQNADMKEATDSLKVGFTFAIFIIYALLAVAFRSYFQPFVVLVAIPFGVIGAIIGHMILGYDLSIVSIMGVIALSGVVVNDSLIMVDYANNLRKSHSLWEAVEMAGVRRFRPIFLTTLTTFGGLAPIIFEKSMQAQYLIPMAISLGFGIVFSTGIILLLVPCLYLILEDIKGFKLSTKKSASAPASQALEA
ncbi:MAG: efflux RND transporter permease subunit [Opitutales bacterium]